MEILRSTAQVIPLQDDSSKGWAAWNAEQQLPGTDYMWDPKGAEPGHAYPAQEKRGKGPGVANWEWPTSPETKPNWKGKKAEGKGKKAKPADDVLPYAPDTRFGHASVFRGKEPGTSSIRYPNTLLEWCGFETDRALVYNPPRGVAWKDANWQIEYELKCWHWLQEQQDYYHEVRQNFKQDTGTFWQPNWPWRNPEGKRIFPNDKDIGTGWAPKPPTDDDMLKFEEAYPNV